LGSMFEAYVCDVLGRGTDRYNLVPEAQLQHVLREKQRADALVIEGSQYVVVESSIQRTFEGVAVARATSVKKQCRAYAHKAEQAEATVAAFDRISRELNLPRPTSITYVLVTENPIPLTHAVAQELLRIDPRRSPRFILGIEELELAIALSVRGWSLPAGIQAWQDRGVNRPIIHDLLDMAYKLGVEPWRAEAAKRWDPLAKKGSTAA
jgi:hypothetical protein